jgi:hypothetical protein
MTVGDVVRKLIERAMSERDQETWSGLQLVRDHLSGAAKTTVVPDVSGQPPFRPGDQ